MVGITAALTGPPSSTYAPAIEALRIYVDRLNAAGGVNGKKIKLVIEDDCAQPSKAAANAKKLLTEDNVGTDAQCEPFLHLCAGHRRGQECRRAADVRELSVPEGRLSAGAARRVLHDGLRRALTTAAPRSTSSRKRPKEPVKIGFSAMAIPLSRGEMDFAESLAGTHRA